MRSLTFFLLMISLLLGTNSVHAQKHPLDGNTVLQAAKDWLALIDEEEYETAWAQSAELLHEKTTQQAWMKNTIQHRQKIGSVRSRLLKSMNRYPKVGLEPYAAVIYFSSEYRNALIPLETVYVVLEKGTWKVGGYYARPEGRRK